MPSAASGRRSPGWSLDELANAGRENLDARHVERYDEKEDAEADVEVRLLANLGLGGGSRVVDMGAGTGQFTIAVARCCGDVVAVDVSPVMLARLRANIARQGVSNVEVVEAGFLSYQHSGALADFVYSRWSLHHLPDFWKAMALTRVRAILRAGGLLRLSDIVFSFDPADAERRINDWCRTLPVVGDEGQWTRGDLEDHVREEHSTYTWLLEPMIERSGFRIEQAVYSRDGTLAEYVARAV
jgi:ubiquinone/menaquinone biosynthesis C-methylase UbiE